jgi:DNA-directed RNA polymerase subunit RPC12/RpoP
MNGMVYRCAACKTPVDEPREMPSEERRCPACGSAERELVAMVPPARATAKAPAPTLDIEPLLDSIALAHLSIVATLATAAGFGIGASVGSAWWGVGAALVTSGAWWGACHEPRSRRVLIRLARSFSP